MDQEIMKKGILAKIVTGDGFSLPAFVNEVQGFSLGLRLTHWETNSYELHKAVEMTQETLDDLLDDFVEACVGMNEGKRPTFIGTISKEVDPDKFIECLKGIQVRDTSLLNIRDEMLQAIYKFKYLKTLN